MHAARGRPGLQCVVEVEGNRAASHLERRSDVSLLECIDLTQGDKWGVEAAMVDGIGRGRGFDRLNPHVRVIELANIQRDPGPSRAQSRILSNKLVGEQVEPT